MAALSIILKNGIEKPILFAQAPAMCLNYYSNFAKMMEYKKCFKILGVSEDSNQEEIREAYLKLVKKYHPDSGGPEADADRFLQIDKAFKILINRKTTDQWDFGREVQEQDIKHNAPQHRQYLSFDGIGVGTPFQRQKQYGKVRAMHAAENVLKHRISKVSAEEGALLDKKPINHKIKTKYGFDRLVEDLIQESISKGEFSNLKGTGKPLPDHHTKNPYVDFVTHKLNEVLIDNGFTPEWITLQKEIREEINEFRQGLTLERSYLGPHPLNSEENVEWLNIVYKYEQLCERINKKIDKFNLVVPIMNKQMVQIDLQNESKKILINGLHSQGMKRDIKDGEQVKATPETTNMFSFLESLFWK